MGEQLRIRLLGEVHITVGKRPVSGLPSRAAEALLIYVACHREPISRERLADLLWDDRDPKQAAANLRSVLSSLRRQLGAFLTVDRQSVAFRHERAAPVDALAFEEGLADLLTGEPARGRSDAGAVERLRTLLTLYDGDFLTGFFLREGRGFEEWAALQRERLRRQAIIGLRRLVDHALVGGDYAQGLVEAHRLLNLDPYSEEAHRQLMLLLARTGQRSAALRQYERLRQLLADDLGVSPLEETTELYERLRAARGIGSHNLPAHATPFVGREDEVASLRRRLAQPDCRLLTLLGPGGIGKTRLALKVGEEIIALSPGMFLDGVWHVALAPVRSTRFLITAIAEAVGLVFHGPAPPERQLEQLLRDRELLLVLDNLEPLLEEEDALRLIGGLLRQAPAVKMLITSRQRLNLREEWVHDVGGLSYPEDESDPASDQHAAVQLFLQNARRLQWDFAPGPAERQAILRICRLLGGMPLGLELASAWIRQYDPQTIAERIAGGLDFLTTPWRNQPERHRSLRAVISQSWELLEPGERGVARQLGVFVGAFAASQAKAVAGAREADLASLVDQSLLRRAPSGRFDWHPLVRHFALEKLAEADGEAVAAGRRHAGFFASLLGQVEAGLNSPEEPALIAEIEAEIDDIQAAWSWSLEHGEAGLAGEMLYGLAYYYDHRSLFQTGFDLFGAALASPAAVEPRLAGRLRLRAGRSAFRLGQTDTSRRHLEQALVLLEDSPSARDRYLAHGFLAELERMAENVPASVHHAERCLAAARETNDVQGITLAYLYLGNAYVYAGQLEQSEAMYEAGLAAGAEACSPRQLATYLDNLGTIAREKGDYEQARDRFLRSLEIRERLDDRWGVAISANNVGVAASDFGEQQVAEQQFKRAIALFREIGHPFGLAQSFVNLSATYQALGRWDEARELLLQSLPLWRELGQRWGLAQTLAQLGSLALEQEDGPEAHRLLSEAVAIMRQLDNPVELAGALASLAVAASEIDEADAARRLVREALAGARNAGSVPAMLDGVYAWAHIQWRGGQPERAGPLLHFVAEHPSSKVGHRHRARRLLGRLELDGALGEAPSDLEAAVAEVLAG